MGGETRPLSRKKRSVFHLGVWDKAELEGTFECRVVFEGTRKECEEEERRLIKLYGKRFDDSGTLCNFVDGGDGGNTWETPNKEQRRLQTSLRSQEMWSRPEYRKKHNHSMKTSQKVKDNCRTTLKDPEVRARHKRGVQKVGKYSQEQLDQKYGSDNKGSRWYFNLKTRQTKQWKTHPGDPWVLGRKPPTEV